MWHYLEKLSEDVIKNLKMESSWVVQVNSKFNGLFPYKKVKMGKDRSYVAVESTDIVDAMKSLESNCDF